MNDNTHTHTHTFSWFIWPAKSLAQVTVLWQLVAYVLCWHDYWLEKAFCKQFPLQYTSHAAHKCPISVPFYLSLACTIESCMYCVCGVTICSGTDKQVRTTGWNGKGNKMFGFLRHYSKARLLEAPKSYLTLPCHLERVHTSACNTPSSTLGSCFLWAGSLQWN